MTAITLTLEPVIHLNPEQFYQLCQVNPDTKLERTASGELVVMAPTGGESGSRNRRLTQRLGIWTDENGTGEAFDSSTMFQLPNGAFRSPDAAWISLERWQALSPEERRTFPPICPDFVVELRSESDTLKSLQEKMQEYLNNGTRLGWLIDPQGKRVEIYRPGKDKEVLFSPVQLFGEDVLPGFILDLSEIL
ncbi:Uma2 family endonuclease [Nostoc sp. FACHB-152]|uniref:Uma2 family endonuclease n=1 Tax=unclassified Nostoc TaxID=2593658 RepID=UPI00168300F7|nr:MULTISPECIES: Uma2 family endonuclease [unclassified Nostoc]MBD2446601.1 Uma2 family endonuclease [Nostoc sp. FACHB-152]MBD2466449.1 Uma2 family endonuclease [Nostoc sp. FACHB-145]